MVKHRDSSVFRLTGLQRLQSDEELEKKLKREFIRKLQPEEKSYAIEVSIVPSLSDLEKGRTAIVKVEDGFPEFLSKLEKDPEEEEQEEIFGRVIHIDCHFHGLTQLYTPAEGPVTGDVIAITGLAGHAYGSWRGRRTHHRMWLHDFFKEDFPQCRTMIYGYDSQISGRSNQHLIDYARRILAAITTIRSTKELEQRPIFFIAHSLGGLILVQALLEAASADSEPDFASIYKATYGIFFFGTPHKGMDIHRIARMIEGDEDRSQWQLLNEIKTDSPMLALQLSRFRDIIEDRKVVSYYEDQQTKAPEMSPDGTHWVRTGSLNTEVSSDSALLLLPGENRIPAKGDHSTIVKFDSKDHETYRSVKSKLQRFEKEAAQCVTNRFLTEKDLGVPRSEPNESDVHRSLSQSSSLPDKSENNTAELSRIVPSQANNPEAYPIHGEGPNMRPIKSKVDKFLTGGRSHTNVQESFESLVVLDYDSGFRPIIGCALDDLNKRDGTAVPSLLSQCFLAVENFGLYHEGIYRLSGSVTDINRLRSAFETNTPRVYLRSPKDFDFNICNVVGLVKLFLKELPDPLFTWRFYSEFINAAQIEDKTQRRNSLRTLVKALPSTHYNVVRALCLHLTNVQKHSAHNRMDFNDLTLCFFLFPMGGISHGRLTHAGWHYRIFRTILENTSQIFE